MPLRQRRRQKQERGSAEPRFLIIGQIRKPHGVRGEMKVTPHTELPERFTWLDTVFLSRWDDDQNPNEVSIRNVRFDNDDVLLKLEGCETRESADLLRNHWLFVPIEQAIPLEEGEYYLFQLMGLRVYADDDYLGEVVDVLETGANNVFVVRDGEQERLLPDIPDVILDINFEDCRIAVHLLPGL